MSKQQKYIYKTQKTGGLGPVEGVMELPIPGEPGNRIIPLTEPGIQLSGTRIIPLRESDI